MGYDRLVAIGVTARRHRRAAVAGLLLLLLVVAPGFAAAQTAALPSLKDPVNDFAKVIDAERGRARQTHPCAPATTGDSLIVVTVPTYAPYGSIEEYAVRLFEKAGIGDKEKDTGLLIVVAVEDRAVRVELGYGLEEFISDGYSGETIRQEMLPRFREGHYGEGLVAGASRLILRIAEKRGVEIPEVPPPPPRPARERASAESVIGTVFFVVVLVFVIARIARNTRGPRPPFMGRRRSTWSGWNGGVGGFGGGVGGFGGFGGGGGGGGGGFGGFGGGSSEWRWRQRLVEWKIKRATLMIGRRYTLRYWRHGGGAGSRIRLLATSSRRRKRASNPPGRTSRTTCSAGATSFPISSRP